LYGARTSVKRFSDCSNQSPPSRNNTVVLIEESSSFFDCRVVLKTARTARAIVEEADSHVCLMD